MTMFERVLSFISKLWQWIWNGSPVVVQRPVESTFCGSNQCSGKLTSQESLPSKSNKEIFEDLKDHIEWGPFFRREKYDLEIHRDRRLGKGAQAEVFEATGTLQCGGWREPLAVKVFNSGFSLKGLQTQWPCGLLKLSYQQDRPKVELKTYRPCLPLGARVLEDDRFAFIFPQYAGDLRSLIDKLHKERNGPPFSPHDTLIVLHKIAKGMAMLHNLGFLHKDLKASNILYPPRVRKHGDTSEDIRDLHIADFESSVYAGGTGFWRAPEILLQLKNRMPLTFTRKADVFSYGMTCYEVLTGQSPLEDHLLGDYDFVIQGGRPTLRSEIVPGLGDLVRSCWRADPHERPSFETMIHDLERLIPRSLRVDVGITSGEKKKSTFKQSPRELMIRSLRVDVEITSGEKKSTPKQSPRELATLSSPRDIAMQKFRKKKSICRHRSLDRRRTEKTTVHSFNFRAVPRSSSESLIEEKVASRRRGKSW